MIDKLKIPQANLSVDWRTAKEKYIIFFPRFSLTPTQEPG